MEDLLNEWMEKWNNEWMSEWITSLSHYVYFSAHNIIPVEDRGSSMVKVLCYKFEGLWYFYSHKMLSHYGPGFDSASNRNKYQEYFLGVRRPVCKADILTASLYRCHELWEP